MRLPQLFARNRGGLLLSSALRQAEVDCNFLPSQTLLTARLVPNAVSAPASLACFAVFRFVCRLWPALLQRPTPQPDAVPSPLTEEMFLCRSVS